MRLWLLALWAFVRELSGEAALARRMAAHTCAHGTDAREAAKAAMSETARERPRCC